MKLFFSEHQPNYKNYVFPYAIWAVPEADESPVNLFDKGFLPASHDLSRFYLCRHIRVHLDSFTLSSENRRILRKGQGIEFELIEKEKFHFDEHWRSFCLNYAHLKFGQNVMTEERLMSVIKNPITSHFLIFKDQQKFLGIVCLFLKEQMAYYYYSFYDLDSTYNNLGMFVMTKTIELFKEKKFQLIYLGSCYAKNALYKTQFKGVEFFNGFSWSSNIKELKYLISQQNQFQDCHLLESGDYLEKFYDNQMVKIFEHEGIKTI